MIDEYEWNAMDEESAMEPFEKNVYCDYCDESIIKLFRDSQGNACCSEECVDANNFDYQRDIEDKL